MSVYRRMIGRALPCGVLDLVAIPAAGEEPGNHTELDRRVRQGVPDIETIYRLGMSHLRREEWGLARHRLNQAIGQEPEFGPARLGLAAVLEHLAQHDEAAAQIDAVMAGGLDSNGRGCARAALLSAAGLSWERSGDWRVAAARYRDALIQNPADPFARQRLAAIHLAHGQSWEAAECLHAALAYHPADQPARICLGHLLQQERRHTEAIWQYEQALCLEPDSWELTGEAAGELQLGECSDRTIATLEELIGAQPQFPDLRLRLGNLYSQRGEDEAACAEYERALALHPDYLDCHIAAARHALRMGRTPEAILHTRHASTINEQHVEAYVGLGLALRSARRVSQAKEMLSSAGRIARHGAVLNGQLGMLEVAAEVCPEGEQCWVEGAEQRTEWIEGQISANEMVLETNPGWHDLAIRQAMLLRLAGQSSAARDLMCRVVREDPAYAEAWMQLGLVLGDLGTARQTREVFATALEVDPVRSELEYSVAVAYCGELEFDLVMERVEGHPQAARVGRRVWMVIDGLQLGIGSMKAVGQRAAAVRDARDV